MSGPDRGPGDTHLLECVRPEPPPAEPMSLVHRTARGEIATLPLAGRTRTTIGRDAGCDLVFADSNISRVHAAIELVEGQHLLRDSGSSNGTFLNGLRLNGLHAFALREGDVIEIGSQRIVYARGPGPPTPVADKSGATHDVDDLLRDGYEALAPGERTRLQVAIQRAFEGELRARGLQAALAIVLERLDAYTAAIFMEDGHRALRVVAALPAHESAGALVALAERVWGDRRGQLVRGASPHDRSDPIATSLDCQRSAAAVPLVEGKKLRGALAVERLGGRRLDPSDLALLAVLGDRITNALVLAGAKTSTDTRPGWAD